MDLNHQLVEEVKHGRVALMFGAGALVGASFPKGKKLLLGEELKFAICSRFLAGEYKDETLQFVSDLAISQAGLIDFQEFIAELLSGIKPSDFHKKIPLFKWRALFTTNYDLLIETSYQEQSDRIQNCRAITSQDDGIDRCSRNDSDVPLIKLHGCVSRRRDKGLPLILTVDQYNDYLEKRRGLFNFLYQVAYENTMVFIGHSLKDQNIRQIIAMVDKENAAGRPRYYLVKPGAKKPEVELWASKRVTVLDGSLEDFVGALEASISDTERKLSSSISRKEHVIQSKFVTHSAADPELLRFLDENVEYVSEATVTSTGDVAAFYSGAGQEWFPILHNLDVSRSLTEKLFVDVIKLAEADRPSNMDFYVVKGEAGAGKSIILRRLSYEAAISENCLCLYVRPMSVVNLEVIKLLHECTNERIFIFWDNAAENSSAIFNFITSARKTNIPITVVTAERYTSWNSKCSELLEPYVTGKFKLPYLGPREISDLVLLLEKHNCLGPALAPLSNQEREARFAEAYGRQLLVALHEVTMGKRFEDIIQDEYDSLEPNDAKLLYRTICVLNRFRVPVRAGLISRVAGITFEDFQKRFFLPLQRVVLSSKTSDYDIHYSARHPEIAEIIFNRTFEGQIDRYHEYIRLIGFLNISFETDKQSLRKLLRAKSLDDLFGDYQDVSAIYEHALDRIGREPYLLQQMANYERLRANGNLNEAIALIDEAERKAPYDNSILHTKAVIWRVKADREEDYTARSKCRREARAILIKLANDNGHTPAIDSVLIQLALDDLADLLDEPSSTERMIDYAIREAEKVFSDSKGRFPTEGSLHALEARFATMLQDEPRALKALKKAFEQDKRDPFIAIRLANVYAASNDKTSAEQILRSAREERRSDHRLNLALGKLLSVKEKPDYGEVVYYLQRSFSEHDQNFEAQFWFARFAIETNDEALIKKGESIFHSLRKARVSHEARIMIRDQYVKNGGVVKVRGKMFKRGASYGFFEVQEIPLPVMLHENDIGEENFALLEIGEEGEFAIGFTYSGPKCVDFDFV